MGAFNFLSLDMLWNQYDPHVYLDKQKTQREEKWQTCERSYRASVRAWVEMIKYISWIYGIMSIESRHHQALINSLNISNAVLVRYLYYY